MRTNPITKNRNRRMPFPLLRFPLLTMVAFLMDCGANNSIRMVAGHSYRHHGGFVATAARTPATAAGWGRQQSFIATSDRNARKLTEAGARTISATTASARLYSSPSDGNDDEKDNKSDGGGRDDENGDDRNKNAMTIDDLLTGKDDFLDRQFFNPMDFDDDDDSPLGRLAGLVRSDYPLFETAFAVSFIAVMVIVSMELLRMQFYGSGYVPFAQGVAPGRLF